MGESLKIMQYNIHLKCMKEKEEESDNLTSKDLV